MIRFPVLISVLGLLAFATQVHAAELHPPASVTAGSDFSIATSGSGRGTFYFIGPDHATKREIAVGSDVQLDGSDVHQAGRYLAILCVSGDCSSAAFYVKAAGVSRLSLIVHPSRVPVAEPNAISAVALLFDGFHNLVLIPETVDFKVIAKQGKGVAQSRPAEGGIAWTRITSDRKEGVAQIGASVGKASEVRVVQQVASEACNLRIKSTWVARKLFVETDPVRDCSGNGIPDGTVVSFTKNDASGRTTVDVPIKKGIAKVEIPVSGQARITVASGVVTGNELDVAGPR